MKYQEAREKTAQYLLDNVCSNYKYEWCNASEGDRDAFRQYANELLQSLLTPAQLEAWKDGGEPVVTDPDQSLPDSSTNKYPDKNKLYALIAIKWYNRGLARLLKNKWMKVVTQQSGGE